MKVTGYELSLWEKLLLKHKLLTKPQWDACVAAWRSQPVGTGLSIPQLIEKQGVKPAHVKQLSDHIRKTIQQAQAQAQAQAQSQPKPAAAASTATSASSAPIKPVQPKPAAAAAPPAQAPAMEGISDSDLSIEGLGLETADPEPVQSQATAGPSTKKVDPVLAPKVQENDDLMPNDSDDVRWNPSEAEWIDDIKETTGAKTARSTDIPQIDLLNDDEADGGKPRPKILKQDDAKGWYDAIGGILSAAGEKKSKEILKLDFEGNIEDPSATDGKQGPAKG